MIHGVNQLRATCSCFAAGIGGADSITVRAHTDALGLPEPIARRIARNVQVILMQESSLARVADPAGGSYYIERLSADYAERGLGAVPGHRGRWRHGRGTLFGAGWGHDRRGVERNGRTTWPCDTMP